MRGVIVESEVYSEKAGDSERVLVFLELEDADGELVLHVRRSYGERASVLTVPLEDLEHGLAALKYEQTRKAPAPIPGQIEIEVDDAEGEA